MHLSVTQNSPKYFANYMKADVHKNTCSWRFIAFWFIIAKPNQTELKTTMACINGKMNKQR